MSGISQFHYLDFIIISVYFLIVLVVGFYYARQDKNLNDYFLAGRKTFWLAIGCSLFMTNISSEHFIGLASSGFNSGMAVGNFEWTACIILVVLGWFIAPLYLRSGIFTVPEYLERRFDYRSRTLLACISIIGYILTKISIILYAGSILLRQLLGWDMYTSSIAFLFFTGIYTVGGGLTSVIYTGVVQTVFFILGAVSLTVFGIVEAGGIMEVYHGVPEDYWVMFKPMSHPDYPWTGIATGGLIIGFWYWCTDMFIVHRLLSARNVDDARSGTILAGFLKLLPIFLLVLPGLIAKAILPQADAGTVVPTMVSLLPIGIKGLVVAGILAALMSSLSACFNTSSTLFTIDIYQKIFPHAPEFRLVNVGRVATLVFVIFGIIWISFIKLFSSDLFVYLQSVQSYIAPPVAAVFLVGMIWPGANSKGALTVLITGLTIGLLRLSIEIAGVTGDIGGLTGVMAQFVRMNFLHFSFLSFLFCVLLMILVSSMTQKPFEYKIYGLTFKYKDMVVSMDQYKRTNPATRKKQLAFTVLLLVLLAGGWLLFS